MKSIYKRLIAYFIDMIIISVITMSITYLPIFNKDLENYRKYLKEYNKEYTEYLNFNNKLNKYYKDNKLTDKEYNKLKDIKSKYVSYLDKYYVDNKLVKKDYKKLTKEVNKDWSKLYKNYNYKLNKYSLVSNISSFVIIFVYFLVANIYLNGQTIGKKIMKLQIIFNNKDKVSIIDYLIRIIVLYNPIYYLAVSFGIYIFNANAYYNWAYIWSDIKNYLEMIIIMMIIVRKDNRGLHEILSNTKVIVTDSKNNNNKTDEEVTIIKKDDNIKPKKRKTKKNIVIEEE